MSPGATTENVLAMPAAGTALPQIIPSDLDMNAILADIQDDHVSAPADQVAGLREVVAHADSQGYDVSFVVLPEAMKFTYYRDIATELQSEVGGTVIVLGPNSVGSSSPYFSRVQQEESTDNLTLTNPPLAARQMWDQMNGPSLDWTAITVVLIVIIVIGAVLARLRSRRTSGAATSPAAGRADGSPADDFPTDDSSTGEARSSGADAGPSVARPDTDPSASAAGPGTTDLSRDLP
ncbi:hypothetical protein GTV32_04760 [Gordonia sp. SID5947]|uniref:Rv1476 family membrane protein n=1 Tax=Gordonia sp. SID5947 TaxID=2690315 RepID=UPI001367ABD5|nr:DUF6676 family protein [Gordonia sp. SID5947]MYR05665.1 hypothetical protein [Gordonia sp. SID5947]